MVKEPTQCIGCEDNPTKPVDSGALSTGQENFTHVSVFNVPQMDCPSEENLIKTAFAGFEDVVAFEFDIPNRKALVYHVDAPEKIEMTMKSIGLGARRLSFEHLNVESAKRIRNETRIKDSRETWVLKWLLGINAVMFFFELVVGMLAHSAGLIADSLDMFADAAVYLVALYAVGKAAKNKLKAAHMSGWLQLILAAGLLIEVGRRTFVASEPVSVLMMGVGCLALIANVACLVLIFKVRNNGTHMKASMIFSANDVLANVGVIIAGGLVAITGSQIPDLIIGLMIASLVLWGAVRILRLK